MQKWNVHRAHTFSGPQACQCCAAQNRLEFGIFIFPRNRTCTITTTTCTESMRGEALSRLIVNRRQKGKVKATCQRAERGMRAARDAAFLAQMEPVPTSSSCAGGRRAREGSSFAGSCIPCEGRTGWEPDQGASQHAGESPPKDCSTNLNSEAGGCSGACGAPSPASISTRWELPGMLGALKREGLFHGHAQRRAG